MRRTSELRTGNGAGLGALAALINETLLRLGTAPAFAGARPALMSVEVGSSTSAPGHPVGRRTPSAHRRPQPQPHPDGGGPRPVVAPAEDGATVAPAADPTTDTVVDPDHTETWQLVRRAQDGDGEAFGQLYDRYVDVVYRFIYFRVNDQALAEDFTSETFLRGLRRIGSISYQGRDIGAWFVTIARNIVLDHIKSARYRLEVSTSETREDADETPGPESAALSALETERLMGAVRRLGEEQRECVMLRFIQGFSVSETAAVMGKNDGAVKALQHRAVRKLAELIGDDLR